MPTSHRAGPGLSGWPQDSVRTTGVQGSAWLAPVVSASARSSDVALDGRADAGPTSAESHHELINESHQRCAALGLSRSTRVDNDLVPRTDLTLARERNHRLYLHAAPVMEFLLEQIVATQSMVLLTDSQGTILHSTGHDGFLERASKVALAPGANWSEPNKGTNAIGTALINEAPTFVHADEHFVRANHFLTCSAAPIFDARGNVLGVLDVTGDQQSFHNHTMGLVRMSARMIENHWMSDDFRHALRLHFHSRPEFIGTLMEGMLAIGHDGRILGANRSALTQLNMSGAAVRMNSLVSLFGVPLSAIVDHFRSPMAMPMLADLPDGRQFYLRARFNWPTWMRLGQPPATGADANQASDVAHADAATPTRTAADAQAGGHTQGAAAQLTDGTALGGGGLVSSGLAAASNLLHAPGYSSDADLDTDEDGLRYLQTGDAQMNGVVGKLRRVIDRNVPILIMGETGTGKELLARAIHHDSTRARQPFVAVNCASIPETLIEAELFGYEEGAFTGARRRGAAGKIMQANGGTLFLDEIGDMPLSLQARLLRVLQERQVTPLGSIKSVTVDVSVVAATHRNLREMIGRGEFREDLYYRLNGLVVKLPPLRERTDRMAIARKILRNESPQATPELDAQVQQLFHLYHWPGNIRQLANVLRTAAVMAAGEPLITRDHLSDDFLDDVQACMGSDEDPSPTTALSPAPSGFKPHGLTRPANSAAEAIERSVMPEAAAPVASRTEIPPVARTLEELELETIRRAVEEARGNISEASKRLGISRNTIYRKLRWRADGAGS